MYYEIYRNGPSICQSSSFYIPWPIHLKNLQDMIDGCLVSSSKHFIHIQLKTYLYNLVFIPYFALQTNMLSFNNFFFKLIRKRKACHPSENHYKRSDEFLWPRNEAVIQFYPCLSFRLSLIPSFRKKPLYRVFF